MSTPNLRAKARFPLVVLSVVTALGHGAYASVAGDQTCRVNDARLALENGSFSELCDCRSVTTGMITYIQNRREFPEILGQTETSCQGLASVLSDVPTASITPRNKGPENDGLGGLFQSVGFSPSGSGGSDQDNDSVGDDRGNDSRSSSGGNDSNGSTGGNDTGGSGGGNNGNDSGGGKNDNGGSAGGNETDGSGGGNDTSGSDGDDTGSSGGGNNGNGKGGGSRSNAGGGNGSEGSPDQDPGKSGNNRGSD